MIIPVRCFTCGKIIADKYDYYIERVNKMEKESGKKVKNPTFKHFTNIHTGEILDDLGLNRYCCRRMLLGTVDMMDKI